MGWAERDADAQAERAAHLEKLETVDYPALKAECEALKAQVAQGRALATAIRDIPDDCTDACTSLGHREGCRTYDPVVAIERLTRERDEARSGNLRYIEAKNEADDLRLAAEAEVARWKRLVQDAGATDVKIARGCEALAERVCGWSSVLSVVAPSALEHHIARLTKERDAARLNNRWTCDVCWTSAFEPCAATDEEAFPDPKDPTQYARCVMCLYTHALAKVNAERDTLQAQVNGLIASLNERDMMAKHHAVDAADVRATLDRKEREWAMAVTDWRRAVDHHQDARAEAVRVATRDAKAKLADLTAENWKLGVALAAELARALAAEKARDEAREQAKERQLAVDNWNDVARRAQGQAATVAQRAEAAERKLYAEEERAEAIHRALGEAERERNSARAALAAMLAWFDSEPVQSTLRRAATLGLTHPHLAVPIPDGFGARAAQTIAQARAVLAAGPAKEGSP